MAGSTTNEAANGPEIDISNQENVSHRVGNSGRNSKQQIRHRASIACYSCRDRRIRCVVPKGGSACVQCKRSRTECVIKMDDERRRPISKAYVSSLSARITMLENMLQEKGVAIPPATHPPVTKHEAQSAGSGDEIRPSTIEAPRGSKSGATSPIHHILSPPYSHEDFAMYERPMEDLANIDAPKEKSIRKEQPPFRALDLKEEEDLHRLFFPNGGLSCDRLSGTLRFFGPTANCHVYAKSPSRYHSNESPEQIRRAERIMRSLTPKTHDYLMQSFWKYHNSVLQVIDRAAFEADRGSENPKFYSSLLHIIILAIGWRFANKDHCDIARINLGNYESTLHREARFMLDVELERPMGIPSVQSLLLLGDLECGVGRDNAGWMFTGMANRLAFDIGLHVDYSNVGLSEREFSVRRRVMKACFLYDRYWALFLGRPTGIKGQDLSLDIFKTAGSISCLSESNSGMPTVTQTMEEEIHEQLIELMNLAGQIVESRCKTEFGQCQAISRTVDEGERNSIDQQLREWYGRLPSRLTWEPENIRSAPSSYFLLHQQFYTIIILLHRSRETFRVVPNDESTSKSPSSPTDVIGASQLSAGGQGKGMRNLASFGTKDSAKSANDVCTQAAIQIAQILLQYKEKYDLEKLCCTGLQPAGTASIALLAATVHSKDEAERRVYLSSLETISDAIGVMSRTYQPAAGMQNLIQSVLAQIRRDTRDAPLISSDPPERGTKDEINGSKSRIKNTDLFSFFPVRQEHRDRDHFLQIHERLRVIPAQAAARSTLSTPPFHVSASSYYSQAPFNHQPSTMSGLTSGFSGIPDMSCYLDSICNPSIGVESIYTNRYSSDNYLRVAPSAKGWGLHSLHAAIQPEQPTSDFDSQMPDWIGEHASFGDPTALHEPRLDDQITLSSTEIGSDLDHKSLPAFKREDTDGLVWMNEGALNVGTPTSPKGLAQELERNRESRRPTALPRNHELDYLSL